MILRCPFCQFRIDTSDTRCRSGCPMGKTCSLVCCPRCHYSFPIPESKVVNFLKNLFSRGPRR